MFLMRVLGCLWIVVAGQVLAYAQELPVRHDFSLQTCSGPEAIAFSPDGKLMACYRNRGVLRLWDVATGKLLDKDEETPGNSYVQESGLAFSPDGKVLAVGVWSGVGTDGDIYLWEIQDGKKLSPKGVLKNNAKGVLALAFTCDGKSILCVGHGKEVRSWDPATGKMRSLPVQHREHISEMVLSSDGKVLVTGDDIDEEVKVWDLQTSKELNSWKVPGLADLALSPDGRVLAVGTFPDGGVSFWDVATGKRRTDLKVLSGQTGPMTYSPDGKLFAAVNADRAKTPTVTVTDIATGRVLARHGHPGHHMHVVVWSPDGKFLISGDYDESAKAKVLLRDASGLLRK